MRLTPPPPLFDVSAKIRVVPAEVCTINVSRVELLWCEIFIALRKKMTLSLIYYVTAHVLLILLETNKIWSYFSSIQLNHNSLVVYRDSLRYINKTDSGFTNALCHRFFLQMRTS